MWYLKEANYDNNNKNNNDDNDNNNQYLYSTYTALGASKT